MNGYRRRENTLDCGDIYKALRGDFVGLLGNATTGQLDTLVAATPEWRVRDVLAHVAGLTEDLNAGNFGVGDPDAFTRTQVDRHRDSSLDEVIAAWAREAPAFEDGLRLLGYQIGNHFLGWRIAGSRGIALGVGANANHLVGNTYEFPAMAVEDKGSGTVRLEQGMGPDLDVTCPKGQSVTSLRVRNGIVAGATCSQP